MKKLLALLLLFGIVGCVSSRDIRTERLEHEQKIETTEYKLEELRDEAKKKSEYERIEKEQIKNWEKILKEIETENLLNDFKNKDTLETKRKRDELNKKKILKELTDRCSSFGFTGDNNIAACVQREAQHDKDIALQTLELQRTRVALQKAQSQSYVQPVTEVKAEEKLHWAVNFLGDIIKEYPEAKAKAAREEAIRKAAYKKGVNLGMARCSGSANC